MTGILVLIFLGAALGVGGAVLVAAVTVVAVLFTAREPRGGPWDVVVVPGALVYPDGSPSPTLTRRVEAAVRLVETGQASSVLVSGRGGGPRTEAEVGAELACSLGLTEAQVELEDASSRTAENARLVASLVEGRRVVVVTDSWHAPRTRLWFRRYLDEVDVVGVPGPRSSWLRQVPREAVKVVVQVFERSAPATVGSSETAVDHSPPE